jgi:hypothetical protein
MLPVRYEYDLHIKSKAIPVTGHGGLKVCEIFRIPYRLYHRIADGGEDVSLTRRPPLHSQQTMSIYASGTHFC